MHLSCSDTGWYLEWSLLLIKNCPHPFATCLLPPYVDFETSLLQFFCSYVSHKYENYNKAPYIFLPGYYSLAPQVRLTPHLCLGT